MNQLFRISYFIAIFMLSSYSSFGQQKEDYSTQIDSLIKTTNVRPY